MAEHHNCSAGSERPDPIRWIKDTYLMWLKGDLEPAHMRRGQEFFDKRHPVPAQPQQEPVAWRVKNDLGHWYVTQHKDLAATGRDFEEYEVQPLYLAASSLQVFAFLALAAKVSNKAEEVLAADTSCSLASQQGNCK